MPRLGRLELNCLPCSSTLLVHSNDVCAVRKHVIKTRIASFEGRRIIHFSASCAYLNCLSLGEVLVLYIWFVTELSGYIIPILHVLTYEFTKRAI